VKRLTQFMENIYGNYLYVSLILSNLLFQMGFFSV